MEPLTFFNNLSIPSSYQDFFFQTSKIACNFHNLSEPTTVVSSQNSNFVRPQSTGSGGDKWSLVNSGPFESCASSGGQLYLLPSLYLPPRLRSLDSWLSLALFLLHAIPAAVTQLHPLLLQFVVSSRAPSVPAPLPCSGDHCVWQGFRFEIPFGIITSLQESAAAIASRRSRLRPVRRYTS